MTLPLALYKCSTNAKHLVTPFKSPSLSTQPINMDCLLWFGYNIANSIWTFEHISTLFTSPACRNPIEE